MAENVVISFQADTAGLVPAINLLESVGAINSENAEKFRKATQDYTNQLNQRVNATKGAFTQLNQAVNSVKADNGLAKALDQSAPVVKTAESVISLRQQVKEAVLEAQNIAAAFGDLDPRAVAAAKRAAELKDQLGDVNARINALNPEAKFQAIAGVASGIAGAFTAAQGALALFGAESEDVQKALLKVQGALALSQGINQVLGLKDAFTNLKAVLGLTSTAQVANTVATEADTIAKGTNVVATEAATVATNSFTAALLANPAFLAVAAITALAGAFAVLSDNQDDATDKLKEFNKELEISKAGYDGVIAAIERQNAASLSALDAQIQIRKNEGAGEVEIFNLRLAKIDEEIKAKERLRRQNQIQNAEDIEAANAILKLGTEDSVKRANEIDKNVEARKNANKQILLDEQNLKQQREVLLSEFGKAISDAEAKRIEEEKKRSEEVYNKRLESIELFYNKARVEEGKRVQDADIYKQIEIEITKAEFREKIALADKFNKDYTQFLLKLQEINRNNVISPIIKIDPAKRASELRITQEDIDAINERAQAIREEEINQLDQQIQARKEDADKRKEILQDIFDTSLDILSDQLNAQFELEQQYIEDRLEAQQESADREAEINQSKYDKGIIGIKEFRDTEKQIEEERKRAQEEAAKKTAEIKRKQDIASRAQAIFEIAVATAANIAKNPGLLPPGSLIPFWIGLGALQAGAVLARPLPKYEKGTLSLKRGNNPLGTDTIPIMANEGEAIIPTGKARAYRPTLEALYKGLLSPAELNGLVRRKLSDKSERSVPVDYDVMASKLGSEIAWRLRGRDGVVVKNVDEFANALSAVPLINRNR